MSIEFEKKGKTNIKKWLTILGTIGLTATSTTKLISCEKPNNKNIPCEKQDHGNWKQQCSQDKPFNKINNKYYFVVWRDSKNSNWNINKFNNSKEIILITGDTRLQKTKFGNEYDLAIRVQQIRNMSVWKEDDGTYFIKAVYRWDGVGEPNSLILSKNLDIYKKPWFYWLFNKLIFLQKTIFYKGFLLYQEFSTKLKT